MAETDDLDETPTEEQLRATFAHIEDVRGRWAALLRDIRDYEDVDGEYVALEGDALVFFSPGYQGDNTSGRIPLLAFTDFAAAEAAKRAEAAAAHERDRIRTAARERAQLDQLAARFRVRLVPEE